MDRGRICKVMIVVPSAIVAAGLRALIADFPDFRVLDAGATEDDPAICFERVLATEPDLVLIDPALFPVMRRTSVRSAFPVLRELPLLAVALGPSDEDSLHEFDGIVNLYDTPARLHHKLRQALERTRSSVCAEGGYELSEREREILVAVARGLTNREIADRYYISIHTVISHRKNISRKTGIRTIAGLTVYALLNNMISEADLMRDEKSGTP